MREKKIEYTNDPEKQQERKKVEYANDPEKQRARKSAEEYIKARNESSIERYNKFLELGNVSLHFLS